MERNFLTDIKKKLAAIGGATVLTIATILSLNPKTEDKDFKVVSITEDKLPKNFEELIKDNQIALNISPTGYRYSDIYKTIDFVKEVLTKYDINAPIFYNIDNETLQNNPRANALLAEEFCNKLTANGCYVGLCGSDDSMIKFRNSFEQNGIHSIDLYDKLIITNSTKMDDIAYDGVYHMVMNSEGELKTTFDVVKTIEENNFNEETNFVEDTTYTVEAGDYLSGIASHYGIKTIDLALYNNLCDKKVGETENENDIQAIYPKDIIKIPNTYINKAKEEQIDFQEEYIVKSGDSIKKIANDYGISEELLCQANDLLNIDGTYKIIYPEDILKVPSKNNEVTPVEDIKEDYNELDNETLPSQTRTRVVKGIDVSFYQGVIDWQKVKNTEDVDFAFIQICDFWNAKDKKTNPGILQADCELKDITTLEEQHQYEADIQFLENIKGCIDNNIPFGIYYYTRATSEEEAINEAKTIVNTLESTFKIKTAAGTEETFLINKLDLPIYMDVEAESIELCKQGKFNNITDAAMNTFKSLGYTSGVYTNTSELLGNDSGISFIQGTEKTKLLDKESNNYISYVYNNGYELWLVNNINWNKKINIKEFNPLQNVETNQLLQEGIDIAQYTQEGSCNGVGANVDIDYANEEFIEECIKNDINNIQKIKQR